MWYMFDTNVAIHTIRHRPREVRAKFIVQHGRMCISTVSLMELIYGAEKSTQPDRNLRDIEAFASRLRILPYDREAAVHTGSIRAALARAGTPIGPYDQMIAGHARSRGLIVVTANTDAFSEKPSRSAVSGVADSTGVPIAPGACRRSVLRPAIGPSAMR